MVLTNGSNRSVFACFCYPHMECITTNQVGPDRGPGLVHTAPILAMEVRLKVGANLVPPLRRQSTSVAAALLIIVGEHQHNETVRHHWRRARAASHQQQ